MTHSIGFDNELYLREQEKAILDRIARFGNKLYLEFGGITVRLDLSEVLICLSIDAASNPMARLALDKLKELQGCEVHTTHIPTPGDEAGLRWFGINLTSDANFSTKSLFVS
jgi:uncharacterized protein (UPF0371 family)